MRLIIVAVAVMAMASPLTIVRVLEYSSKALTAYNSHRSIVNTPSLSRRKDWPEDWPQAADDGLMERTLCKGGTLVRGMVIDDNEAGQMFTPPRQSAASPFVDFPYEFMKWGWHLEEDKGDGCQLAWAWGLGDAMRGLGSTSLQHDWPEGTIWCYEGRHFDRDSAYDNEEGEFNIEGQTYQAEGRTYRMTGGEFTLAMDPTNGVLVALSRYGCAHTGLQREPPVTGDGLPRLFSSSDVLWGTYRIVGGTNNIRWMMSASITNIETLSIVKAILDRNHLELGPWPGAAFRADTEPGRQLLATPNGRGFAYLLIQRKNDLGKKYIYSARVFHNGQASPRVCIAFEVKDVPRGANNAHLSALI